MRKINWEDYPSTATPINADNLNAMQDNIESEIEGRTVTIIETDMERQTNTYIDQKRIYVKKINIGALPNNGRKTITAGLSNIYEIIEIEGYASKDSGNDYMNIIQATSSILYRKSTDTLFIDTNTDRSDYTGKLIIYYTKT